MLPIYLLYEIKNNIINISLYQLDSIHQLYCVYLLIVYYIILRKSVWRAYIIINSWVGIGGLLICNRRS